jgi:hypothetical protein
MRFETETVTKCILGNVTKDHFECISVERVILLKWI